MIRASNYEQCLKNCQTNNTNFEDKTFPPNSDSLNFTFGNRKIIWKRIVEVIENPVMI